MCKILPAHVGEAVFRPNASHLRQGATQPCKVVGCLRIKAVLETVPNHLHAQNKLLQGNEQESNLEGSLVSGNCAQLKAIASKGQLAGPNPGFDQPPSLYNKPCKTNRRNILFESEALPVKRICLSKEYVPGLVKFRCAGLMVSSGQMACLLTCVYPRCDCCQGNFKK